ncbi:MAG: dienelactone hydrolase family protein [Chloroflexi bacterium]|nr:dienelactone hydrolase family protein [Chloroflexota bacterium]
MAKRADEVSISAAGVTLAGNLAIPEGARGIVVFAHGSGSSRHSPRNQYVAQALDDANIATLLMDLLTEPEDAEDALTARLRFDIALLAERVGGATDWLAEYSPATRMTIGYFGASTGAAAALVAAAARPQIIRAIVSRGGRPDLASAALARVQAPTLLIVGGYDTRVIEMNHEALAQLSVEKDMQIVPRATHLFEEPGALEQVAALAREWFERYL